MARKTIHHKHGKPRASLRCSAGDLILVDDGLKCVNCEVLVVEHLAEESGIDREKLIAESAKCLAGDENEKLLAFLADEHKRYLAEILPMYPPDDIDADGYGDFKNFDEARNEFLESLWDVIQQHFDDKGAR